LFVEPAGTHYAVVEFPGEIAAEFRRFMTGDSAE
jgi:hypothetical protein